jgi:DNA repair photolyase
MKIYEPSGRAREYSPLALNYFKGCTHNCKYCYVSRINKAFGIPYTQDVCDAPREEGFIEFEKSAKKMEGCNKQILLSFTGDPYCDMPPTTTTRVLEILLRYRHKVAILTKGGKRSLRDLELFKRFGDNIKVGATLTFENVSDSLDWESGAALPEDRIESLKVLSGNGIKTWVSFEPVIIPEQSTSLLSKISSFVDAVKIGKINDYNGIDKRINWAEFIKNSVEICRDNKLPFYIKKDLAMFNKGVPLYPCETDKDFLNL